MSATLQDIRLKVRRITKSPSVNQITDAQIDQYVNTFYLWDFPEHLRLFDLTSELRITCSANIDTYDLPTSAPTNVSPVSLGNVSGTSANIDLIATLGLPADATIIPGSILVNVNSASPSAFTEVFPYTGELVADAGDGTQGLIDYQNCVLQLSFSSSIAASPATIQFSYTVPEFITIMPPLYIAGFESYYTQSQAEFFRLYPIIRTILALTYGTGSAGPYTGTLSSTPVLRNNVLIDTVDTSGNSMSVSDDGNGNLVGNGTGTINYVTGAISVSFNQPVQSGAAINTQTVPYVGNRPAAALYFNDQLTLRPVPDQAYTIQLQGFRRPTALIAQGDTPVLREWWQLLAMGAALKIFEDRGDFNSINLYMPLFNQYRNQAERKTIVQLTNNRSQTVYTEMTQAAFGNFYGTMF